MGDRYFKGTGTSQSTAVVAGAAALLLSAKPWLNNDQVKRLLMYSASPMPSADAEGKGAGSVNVNAANKASIPYHGSQKFVKSLGLGSIAKSRGSAVIKDSDGVPLLGDVDIFGQLYNVALSGNSWSGGTWNGNSWSGNSWSGNSWSAVTWQGNSWSGNSWSSLAWLGNSWSGNSWSGNSWSCNFWSIAVGDNSGSGSDYGSGSGSGPETLAPVTLAPAAPHRSIRHWMGVSWS